MSRFFKAILLVTSGLFLFSCNKEDSYKAPKPEPYDEQYVKDLAKIDEFIDNYHMKVDPATFEVSFKKIQTHGADSLPIRTQAEYPLKYKMVENEDHEVNYKVYYIDFVQGTEVQPTRVDSVLVSYRGEYMYSKTEEIIPATNPKTYRTYTVSKEFEQVVTPVWFPLDGVIEGWKEMLPLFKSGTSSYNSSTGEITYQNSGAGLIFIPSALAYYSTFKDNIPSYSPLIFSFKLRRVNHTDFDGDGIDSYLEDLNGNGNFKDDDTDGDKLQNYQDFDDDGDGVLTKLERTKGDTDGDGKPNYLDNDDDNDGVLTVKELTGDCNNNGVPNYLDPVACP